MCGGVGTDIISDWLERESLREIVNTVKRGVKFKFIFVFVTNWI